VTSRSILKDGFDNPRYKTVSGLRPLKLSTIAVATEDLGLDSDIDTRSYLRPSNVRIEPLVR
jgi:hypothetical protein